MERVQFQQEQMLAELKDLVQKGLFTKVETKQIMKKRTAFETALVRRVSKKSDFIRYAAYEMGLEQLRRKRVERLQLPPSPPSISDYALVRRQFHIFERALKKFKSDVGLWIQYVQVAKREGAQALVGRIIARALQLHPNTPALYILAASHELSQQSPSAARTLLQRGIRLNSDSVDIWREYVRMELGFIEGLRRRWDVLGIDMLGRDGKGKEKAKEVLTTDLDGDAEADVTQMDLDGGAVEAGNDEEDNGMATRKAIMDGAIVKSVISSASKSLPKIGLFTTLFELITAYPSPLSLKESLLDHLLVTVCTTLPDDPLAVKLAATRALKPNAEGKELVEALKTANEVFLTAIDNEGKTGEDFLRTYAEFIGEWCRAHIDDNLRLYLTASLRSLAKRHSASPSLASAHIRLLKSRLNPIHPGPAAGKILNFARKYTSTIPKSAEVWLARLDAEKDLSSWEEVEHAWSDARSSVEGTAQDAERVWLWGLEHYPNNRLEGRLRTHKLLLQESMRSGCSSVHETLLINYATLHVGAEDAAVTVRRIAAEYLVTAEVWATVFAKTVGMAMAAEKQHQALQEIYELWRTRDGLGATVAWARWLLNNRRGKEAGTVVVTGGSRLKDAERKELEKRWMVLLKEGEGVDSEELKYIT